MGKNNIIYPILDEKREVRIPVCTERLLYGEGELEYFFSPGFKKSKEVIDGILRGYVHPKGLLKKMFSKPELMVRLDFDKDNKAKAAIKQAITDSKLKIKYGDVIAYFKNGEYYVLLTKDRFLSTYKHERTGEVLDYPIRNINIISTVKIKEIGGDIFRFPDEFSKDFISLLNELKDLNRELEPIAYNHPLNGEKRDVRESYMGILVDKSLSDGSLSSNEVIRLEILARQIGIDSKTVLEQIAAAIKRYDEIKADPDSPNDKRYIHESLKRMENIASKYQYMLYHDVITFEILSNKGEVAEQMSEFSRTLSKRCDIDEQFREKYSDAMQKLVVSSYALRDSMQTMGNRNEDREAYDNLFKSVEYEYNLQKELLQ